MLEARVHNILVCGGTGEFAYLRPEERKKLVEVASKHIDGKAGFVVQTSAINTADAVDFSKHAEDNGADCLLILPPYFEGPGEEGICFHFEQISKSVNTSIMVYNIPSNTGVDITPPFFRRLTEIANIEYMKDSTGDLIRIQQLLSMRADVLNGGDPIAFYSLLAGCKGCVWGAVNAMPHEAVMLYEFVQEERIQEARDLWKRMLPANNYFWSHEYNPSVKAATNLSGRKVGPCRYPVQPLSEKDMDELSQALKPLGF